MFQKPIKKQWTWQSPNGVSRNQKNYVTKFQKKNSILDAWAEPSADCGSNQNPVIVKFRLRFQLKRQKAENVERIDWQKFDSEINANFKSIFFD